MSRIRVQTVLAALTALGLCGVAAPAISDSTEVLDAQLTAVTQRLSEVASEGASGFLRISLGDEVLLQSGFGSASCDGQEVITPDHLFMIGSITKDLTQLLAFVLEEKGVFSFDDTVADLLPGFEGEIGQVTLQQLLDHTGGLPDLIDSEGQPVPYTVEYDYEPVTRAEIIRRAELAELIFEPGTNEEYANLGYQLLAAIYEVATDETYPDLLRRYVYHPAGMTGTDFWFADTEARPVVDGCRRDNARWGNPLDDAMWGEAGPSWNLIGAGGLLSTTDSLNKFLAGIGDGVYFESPEQAEKYRTARLVYSERMGQRIMGPAGSNGIFNAVAYWAEDDRLSVIMFTNRAAHPAEGGLVQEVLVMFPPDVLPNNGKNQEQ